MVTIKQYRKFLGGGNKYGAIKTEYNGVVYDSKAEANRATELDLLVRTKVIENVQRQVKFPVVINGVKVFVYIADFTYQYTGTGLTVIEDVKGVRTAMFNLKKKCVEAQYGVTIQLV